MSGVISYRRAEQEDAQFLFELKNDAAVKASSILARNGVRWDDHVEWLMRALRDRRMGLWIILRDGIRVGTFRTEPFAGYATEVAIHLDPASRGNGLGGRVISDWCTAGNDYVARIVDGNEASIALFTKAGFVPGKQQGDAVPYRFYYYKGCA